MDMSSYRDLFFNETREHINNLNKLIVALEQEPGDRETINALFREAHSIKGMAATMGFERTAQLSHHLEDLLDEFRASGLVPSATIDYLLEGIDLLEGLVDDLQANRDERDTEAFMAKEPGDEQPPAAASPTADAVEPRVTVAVDAEDDNAVPSSSNATEEPGAAAANNPGAPEPAEETDTFQVFVTLAEDTPAAAARGVLILRELAKVGELKASTPDLETLRAGGPCQQVQAWLCTSLDKGHIEDALLKISGVAEVRFIDDRRREDRRHLDEGARTVRVRTDLLDQFVNLTGELITQRYMLNTAAKRGDWESLNQALGQADRLIEDLHHQVLQARLMPLENITGRLPRIVRDLNRKSGKKVALQMTGTDVGIDRVILEELADPLVHLVRNAVDHGIDQQGTVTVSARREKDLVLVEVADDGKGMDPDALRRKAVERGMLSAAQAESLNERDVLMLVCQPGFSTAAKISETSGRGVGMDVVKAAVGNLGGTLDIISAPGKGTRFQLRLPLSIAIIKILLIGCAGHTLAVPLTRVQRALDIPTDEVLNLGYRRFFCLEEEDIDLYALTDILDLPPVTPDETTWVILTEVQGRRIGLQVDHFIGQREAFVKQIGFPLNLLSGLSGATVEGNGQVVFILDPPALLENRHGFSNQ